jgi:hypothetical protein
MISRAERYEQVLAVLARHGVGVAFSSRILEGTFDQRVSEVRNNRTPCSSLAAATIC